MKYTTSQPFSEMLFIGLVQCCFTSTETKGQGRTAQDGHLDFHKAPELSSLVKNEPKWLYHQKLKLEAG